MEYYEFKVLKKRFWLIYLPGFIGISVVCVILGIFVFDRLVMPNLPGLTNKGMVKVPSIVEMERDEAKETLYDYGLRMTVSEKRYDEEHARGVVISQSPDPGKKVKKSRHVFVVVSNGSEAAEIIDVRGMSSRRGARMLRKAGFPNLNEIKVFSSNTERHNIVKTDPESGSAVSRDMEIKIFVSKGNKPTHAEVPSLAGLMLSEAKDKIRESDLTLGNVEYKEVSGTSPGRVVAQSVSPGASVDFGSSIDIQVSVKK